jgi:hypothetical protein
MPETLLVPDSDDEVTLADWLELVMLTERRRTVSRARLRRALAGSLYFDEDTDTIETTIDVIFQEVGRRQRILETLYPFVETDHRISMEEGDHYLPYVFMLLLAGSKSLREEKRYAEVDELFDNIVLSALKNYLGPGSKGVRFGSPASEDRPTDFRGALQWLAEQLGLRLGVGHARPQSRDGGVDVVVWKPFRDCRSSFITILAQCTIQIDWPGKEKDVIEGIWRGYIDFGLNPVTAIAIPFVISTSFQKWDEIRRTVLLILDRLRLCELLENFQFEHRERIEEWVASELRQLVH